MTESIIISQPPQAEHLYLLFHGVGSTPQSMEPLGRLIAAEIPQAAVISVCAPMAFDQAENGYQWFSVAGVNEANREQRVRQAMPDFLRCIHRWQEITASSPQDTTLIGFSQGAIMSLSLTQMVSSPAAAQIIALSGRLCGAQHPAKTDARIHILHGRQDPVMPYSLAEQAFATLKNAGTEVTLDLFDGLGHSISPAEAATLLSYIK